MFCSLVCCFAMQQVKKDQNATKLAKFKIRIYSPNQEKNKVPVLTETLKDSEYLDNKIYIYHMASLFSCV